jgi:hypothetical protein
VSSRPRYDLVGAQDNLSIQGLVTMRTLPRVLLLRPLLALLVLLAATAVHAQAQNPGRNLNVFGVNLDNKNVYSISFSPPGGSTTISNTDQNNYVRPEALAFVINASTNQLDLLIADNQRGTIYRYPGALAPQTPPNPTVATLVWNTLTSGTGPTAPDALAVDGYGNLFVANSTSGHSQSTQLWEFPVGTAGSGSFAAPVLLDNNFQNKETLLEVTLAPTDVAGASGVSGGDLILLTTSRVLAYSQASGYKTRITLLSFPNGSPVPGGMDFWPLGNGAGANYSLLVSSSSTGVINRYYFTNPLTAAPAPFYSGLGTLYRIKTLFQQGNPLLFVSENGAILEFSATANGLGTLLATVTQNVTIPQGLAVSNAFTNAASVCLQPGGCDLTGLLTHAVGNTNTLTGNIVENVCTVNADPRVSISSGQWSCSVNYTPPGSFTCPGPNCLPVNAVCPGFDDTGKMAIPDTVCGASGSTGAGFSLLKTLIPPTQFNGTYVQNAAVLADGSNPVCGPGPGADGAFLWAPLQAEGTVFESPNMIDVTSGCGSIHGGTAGLSVWMVGGSVNEAAPELNPSAGLLRPLENFTQTKYANLTTTIDGLTQTNASYPWWTGNYPNIAGSVSLLLWGGNVPPATTSNISGCLDQSWLDFYNATKVDTDGSPQWIADLQNAANMLTTADVTGNTTCDGTVDNELANNPTAFVQTPNPTYPSAPIVLNPSGQLRSRFANTYYTINTRILGNIASQQWPLPVSVNVLPTAVTLASGSTPGTATLSWNTNGASSCLLTSSDNTYVNAPLGASPQTLNIPVTDAGSIVKYTVSCTGPASSSVYAYVTVYPPPTISLAPSSLLAGTSSTLTWNTNHAQGCMGSSNDPSATTFNQNPVSAMGSPLVTPPSPNSYTYTLACAIPNTPVSATLTVVAPPTLTITQSTALLGTGTSITWNDNGNSGCTWSSTDSSFTAPTTTSGSTAVNPGSAGSFTYTLMCTIPVTTTKAVSLSTVQQPTVGVTPTSVVQGSAASLTWNTFGNSGCGWSSTDSSFTAPAAASGTQSVKPASAGTFTYTLTCAAPTAPAMATLAVTAPPPPVISVSPSSIVLGSAARLAWTMNSGDVCSASSAGTDTNPSDVFSGPIGATGAMTLTPNNTGTNTYTLGCAVPATSVSTTLTVTSPLAKIAISIKPVYDLDIGDPGILAWSLSAGATGCVVSGSWPKYSAPQFSPFAVSASGSTRVTWNTAGTYTYTLSCTNPSTPAQTSVNITNER